LNHGHQDGFRPGRLRCSVQVTAFSPQSHSHAPARAAATPGAHCSECFPDSNISVSRLTAGEAPPTQLRGKSIVVIWAESRIQRDEGQQNFRPVNANRNITIYISTLGRVFSRATNATQRGSGGSDQVQGESSSATVRPRVPSFSGQSMTYYQPMGPTGMRRP
jgi:hypothetical protein